MSPLRLDGLVKTIKAGQFGDVFQNVSDVAAGFLHGPAGLDKDSSELSNLELRRGYRTYE